MTRYLVINGDDFGLSLSVNMGMIQAHQQGILTSTSLMVAEDSWQDAVQKAHENPNLGVGLHLVLVCGKSVLSHDRIPHLVNEKGYFLQNAFHAGLRYQFNRKARAELRLEIYAQLKKFQQTGLKLSHVDGHLHLHVHPVILEILSEFAEEFSIHYIRFPYEELSFTLKLNSENLGRKFLWSKVFTALRRHGERALKTKNTSYLSRVYGLLETGNLTEDYLLGLIPQIQENEIEIYSHPAIHSGQLELDALISPKVKDCVSEQGFILVNYHQLGVKRD